MQITLKTSTISHLHHPILVNWEYNDKGCVLKNEQSLTEGLVEIFTCILYWLISAIKMPQTSLGVHTMTWNLCLHCNEWPQQQRSARSTIEHSENSINKQSSSNWLNSCHVVFLVDYLDCPFLLHTIDKCRTSHTGYLISLWFWFKMCASVFDPDIPRTQLFCKLPSDFLVLPGLSWSSRWAVCTITSPPPLWMKREWEGRRTLWGLISST